MKEGASHGKGGQPRLQSFCPYIQAWGVSPLRFNSQRLPQVALAKVHFPKSEQANGHSRPPLSLPQPAGTHQHPSQPAQSGAAKDWGQFTQMAGKGLLSTVISLSSNFSSHLQQHALKSSSGKIAARQGCWN